MNIQNTVSNKTVAHYLQRFGLVGFTFFFIKGLLWLFVPLLTLAVMN